MRQRDLQPLVNRSLASMLRISLGWAASGLAENGISPKMGCCVATRFTLQPRVTLFPPCYGRERKEFDAFWWTVFVHMQLKFPRNGLNGCLGMAVPRRHSHAPGCISRVIPPPLAQELEHLIIPHPQDNEARFDEK